ncbi:MAG TPA: hypothetical protein VES40_12585 [Ilumatobacteraceae bacterium]|nr:hypothetical protein [Ilumatobacteraceae bacterium]
MFARKIWSQLESVHAVTYFAPESLEAARAAGLRGFWMGYFGFRACPLGPVDAGVVEAAFANFAPAMVRRAIPDAWKYAGPSDLMLARSRGAASALRRTSSQIERAATAVNDDLELVISCATSIGRPLFAANRDIVRLDDPVARLWQNCTTLREHRGDGHVAALASAGIDGCEAHLLIAAEHGWQPEVFFDNRGWSGEQQQRARTRLVERDLLNEYGQLTTEGAALRSHVEATTDLRAAEPYERALRPDRRAEMFAELTRVANDVIRSETIPFPNPMGLPRPSSPPA